MKCKYCNGTGEVEIIGDSVTDVCDKCGGTGFFCEMKMGDVCTLGSPCPYQEPMTNEEWLRQKSVEELAVFLAMVQLDEYEEPIDSAYVNTWVLWLKERHE